MSRQCTRKSTKHWYFARHSAYRLIPLGISSAAAEASAASCTFVVQGPETVGERKKNWGCWIRTRLHTYGDRISGATWQHTNGGASADSEDAANLILGQFDGITVQEVYDEFGQPNKGVLYNVDLVDVVNRLRPNLIELDRINGPDASTATSVRELVVA